MGPADASGRRAMVEVPGSEAELDCDLVLLALGFVHPVHSGLVKDLGLALNERGNVAAAVSSTHLRAHETVLDIVCRLLLEKT